MGVSNYVINPLLLNNEVIYIFPLFIMILRVKIKYVRDCSLCIDT